MSSLRVGPDAPNASVAAGARARTPNVKTPETTWPSPDSACQRTVYAPFGSRDNDARTKRPSSRILTARSLPVTEYTRTDPGIASTYWSKRRTTEPGEAETDSRKPGDDSSNLAC